MNVIRTTRKDPDFYLHTGPYFGSRAVERATHDRFFDDPGKTWYISAQGAASVLNGVIRNFYAASEENAAALIGALLEDHSLLHGIVPRAWREVFHDFGFHSTDYRTNFMEVYYEAD